MNELNSVVNKNFPKIHASEFIIGHQYRIQEVVYIKTHYNDKTVVARVLDVHEHPRSYFLPSIYAAIFTSHFEKAEDINCHELHLVFKGFEDTTKNQCPLLEFQYMGNAQHYK